MQRLNWDVRELIGVQVGIGTVLLITSGAIIMWQTVPAIVCFCVGVILMWSAAIESALQRPP